MEAKDFKPPRVINEIQVRENVKTPKSVGRKFRQHDQETNKNVQTDNFPVLKPIPQQVFGIPEELQAMTWVDGN